MKLPPGHYLHLTSAPSFLEIAQKNHEEYLKACERLDELSRTKGKGYDPEIQGCLIDKVNFGNITIVFSVTFLDAFIFDFALLRLGIDYYEKHLDKLSIPSKFLMIPRLAGKQLVDEESSAYNQLNELVSCRNQLIHSRSTVVKVGDQPNKRQRGIVEAKGKCAKGAIDTIRLILSAFDQGSGDDNGPDVVGYLEFLSKKS